MEKIVHPSLDAALGAVVGHAVDDYSLTPVSGGDINEAFAADIGATRLFIKRNRAARLDDFRYEASSLAALSGGALETARALALARDESHAYLILEWLERARPNTDFWPRFGAGLAACHLDLSASRYGWGENRGDDWISYFRDHRLHVQLETNWTALDASSRRAADRLLTRLEDTLAAPTRPQLVHGDLWHGNFLVGASGKAVLIDPQCYYGHGEVDLAMSRLFGGFAADFYRAYQEANPAEAELDMRLDLYSLVPLLTHLHLFGAAYLDSCRRILLRYGG